jgi:hypothetical protein
MIKKNERTLLKKTEEEGSEQEHPVGGPASCSADKREAAALLC